MGVHRLGGERQRQPHVIHLEHRHIETLRHAALEDQRRRAARQGVLDKREAARAPAPPRHEQIALAHLARVVPHVADRHVRAALEPRADGLELTLELAQRNAGAQALLDVESFRRHGHVHVAGSNTRSR